jgi:hypothetical protein
MDHLYTKDQPKFPLNDLNIKRQIFIKIIQKNNSRILPRNDTFGVIN